MKRHQSQADLIWQLEWLEFQRKHILGTQNEGSIHKAREEVWNGACEASHESRWPNGTLPPVKWSQNGWTNVMLLLLPQIIKEMAKLTRLVVRRVGERETERGFGCAQNDPSHMTSVSLIVGPVLLTWRWRRDPGRRLVVVWLWWLSWQWQSTELLRLLLYCVICMSSMKTKGKAAMGAGEGRTLLLTPN